MFIYVSHDYYSDNDLLIAYHLIAAVKTRKMYTFDVRLMKMNLF